MNHPTNGVSKTTYSLLAALMLLPLLSCALTPPLKSSFALSDTATTFTSVTNLKAGDVIHVSIQNLAVGDYLMVRRCENHECRSADIAYSIPNRGEATFERDLTIKQSAEYYFWMSVNAQSDSAHVSPIVKFEAHADRISASFANGTSVTGYLKQRQ